MRYIKIMLLILIVGIVCSTTSTCFASPIDIQVMAPARAMAVLEGNTDTSLYEYNAHTKLAQASTTKITTAIVALENCDDLDAKFVVSDRAVGIEGTSIYLNKDEQISMRELLYGLMLASGNDCAVAIAEQVCGYADFVDKMNEFVKSIGATNTHYDNPHGLDSDAHYTTAYDLALITSYALKNPEFREIASTKYHTIPATNNHDARYLKHKNKLLFTHDNCIGVKTGFTDNAGRCLVNAFEDKGMMVISVVLNCGPMFEEALRITNKAFDEYTMREFIPPYYYVGNIRVIDGDIGNVGVVCVQGFKIPIKVGEYNNYEIIYDYPRELEAPLIDNTVVGSAKVLYNGTVLFESPLYATASSRNNNFRTMIDNIIDKWYVE